MRRVPDEAQWEAARRMLAGEAPTAALAAGLLGVTTRAVHKRAAAEGWSRLDFSRKETRAVWNHAIAAGQAALVRARLGIVEPSRSGEAAPAAAAGARDAQASEAVEERAEADAPGESGPNRTEGDAEPAETRFRRVMEALLDEVEAFGLAPGRVGAAIDRTRVETLWTVIRTLERAERFLPRGRGTGAGDAEEEDPAERSRRTAEVLAKIDARIFELAYVFAKEMVEGGWDGGASGGVSGSGGGRVSGVDAAAAAGFAEA